MFFHYGLLQVSIACGTSSDTVSSQKIQFWYLYANENSGESSRCVYKECCFDLSYHVFTIYMDRLWYDHPHNLINHVA